MKTADSVLIRLQRKAPVGQRHHISDVTEAICAEIDILKNALEKLQAILPRKDEA